MVSNLAKEHGVEARSRTFTPWSHVVSLVYAHLTHAVGLNDVCDALQMNEAALSTLRGAVPPTRNNLSHSNKVRNADMAEALYW
ncbi:MAG: IS4 family transposase, partial [Verrucomicrobia bacterium]